ncbi:hypothetical protein llap_21096 [Limosa lapponica baueri]|uniref:Anaphase-promoting complex subunit 2 TPR repeats domain-containing protein n=1 Tax=Limosa lapponica baueri TaxID=1758121 RepID=A0A2I0T477_LIMLA|nr:hypothetical protein llap_21096 [Limosa lapponica baueri]
MRDLAFASVVKRIPHQLFPSFAQIDASCSQWIEKVIGWLSRVFLQDGPSARSSPEASSTLKRWRCHVQRFFYRIYASMRIEELFSIIRDFPESKPAVEDLKFCLERTNQRQQLLSSLKSALEMRLLHPGGFFILVYVITP